MTPSSPLFVKAVALAALLAAAPASAAQFKDGPAAPPALPRAAEPALSGLPADLPQPSAMDPLTAISAGVTAQVEAAGAPNAAREASAHAGENIVAVLQGGSASSAAGAVAEAAAPTQTSPSTLGAPASAPHSPAQSAAGRNPLLGASSLPLPGRYQHDWRDTAAAVVLLAAVAAFFIWAMVTISEGVRHMEIQMNQLQNTVDELQ